MPEVRVRISMSLLKKLEHLKEQWGISSSSKLIEILLKELLEEKETKLPTEEE